MTATLLPYGPGALLVEVPADDVIAWATAIRARADPAVTDVVPAARTVLVRLAAAEHRERVDAWLRQLQVDPTPDVSDAEAVELTVVYDGADLPAVAEACSMTADDVVARHAAATYVCAFCGFAPGFGYLTGLDPALHLPRRSTPRTRVPAGSVAIAAGYSAVYPSASPGGWHLLGRTEATLFDAERSPPSAIVPGTRVRFVPA